MAWFGIITDFTRINDSWNCDVDYYDDANPDATIPRTFSWPLGITRAQAVSDIRAKGAEVRSFATINTQGLIGTVISIP